MSTPFLMMMTALAIFTAVCFFDILLIHHRQRKLDKAIDANKEALKANAARRLVVERRIRELKAAAGINGNAAASAGENHGLKTPVERPRSAC